MRDAARAPWNSPAAGSFSSCLSKVLCLSLRSWSPGAGCSAGADAPHPFQGLQQRCSVTVLAQAAGEGRGALPAPQAREAFSCCLHGLILPHACMGLCSLSPAKGPGHLSCLALGLCSVLGTALAVRKVLPAAGWGFAVSGWMEVPYPPISVG